METTIGYGSRLQTYYEVEDSWGIQESSPTVYKLRCTSFGVNLNRDSFTSNELRTDREVYDFRQGMDNVSGDIAVELSYGAFDDLIASAMFNSWASADTITIGTTQSSLRLHRGFSNIQQYHEFPGCVVNSWSLSLAPNSIVTSTFNFMGKTMVTYTTEAGDTASAMSGAIDKATNEPFDSFSGAVYEGGTTSSDEIAIVTGFDLTLDNGLTSMQVVGNDKPIGMAEARGNVTGTVTAYFSDRTLLKKFLDETESEIKITMTDNSSNSMELYLPRIKYSGGSIDVGDEGPVTISLPFQALKGTGAITSALQVTKV